MRLLLTRLPLFAGIILLQVSPTAANPPSTLTDLLLQGLSNVPVYVILAYIVINIQRTTAKENERRDGHETTITELLGTQIKRVDVIEEDRRAQWEAQKQADNERDNRYIETFQSVGDSMNRIADLWTVQQKSENERDRVLSDATSAMTAIVTVGSKPLQQVVKDVGALQETSEEIQKAVSQIFDRYALNFPTQRPIDELFEQLKSAILEAIEKKCGDQIRPAQELPATTITNIVNAAPAGDKAADGDGLQEVA